MRLFGGPLITHCSIASAPFPGPQASDVGHRTTSLLTSPTTSQIGEQTAAMPARRQREHSQANPPSVASKWPTKMRESRPQVPACWPRIPHAGKLEMPLKGPSFQPIPSLQPVDRRSTPRSLATELPLPLPSGSETSSLVSHDAQLQTDRFGSVRPRFQAVLSCPILSPQRSLLRASNTCSTPSPDRAIPSLSYQHPFLRYSRFTIELQFCDYSAVASASISNPSPPLAITRCCAMLFFACRRAG